MSSHTNGFVKLWFETEDAAYTAVSIARELECRIELLGTVWRFRDGADLRQFVQLTDHEPGKLTDRIEQSSAGEHLDVFTQINDYLLAEYTPEEGIVRTLAETGAIIHSAVATGESARFAAILPPGCGASDVIGTVRDAHPSVDLVGKRQLDVVAHLLTPSGFRAFLTTLLTERQWEALQLAHRGGYFERPRECTQSELAAEMDVSQETFSQHLATAQRKLLNVLFQENWLINTEFS